VSTSCKDFRTYDLFENLPDGTVLWLGVASDPIVAVEELKLISEQTLNEVFIIELQTNEIIGRKNVRAA
jgi:hypothetical protein